MEDFKEKLVAAIHAAPDHVKADLNAIHDKLFGGTVTTEDSGSNGPPPGTPPVKQP